MIHLIAAALIKAGNTNPVSYLLTGTSGTPTSRGYTALQPETASLSWIICGNATGSNNTQKGYVQYAAYDASASASYVNEHAFVTPNSGWGTLYVRLTQDSGTTDSTTHAIDGTTWHTLTEDTTNITWTESHDGAVNESCVVKVEIATDSLGTDIVATGYYESVVNSEP